MPILSPDSICMYIGSILNAHRACFVQPTESELQAAFRDLLTQANARAFIAYADDTAVGYVLVLIQEKPASISSPARRWLYVDQISVEPQWEGAVLVGDSCTKWQTMRVQRE